MRFVEAIRRSDEVARNDPGRIYADDPIFNRVFAQSGADTTQYDRLYTLVQLLKLVEHLDGAAIECGAYRGASAFVMMKMALQGSRRTLHVCDSGKGLSKPGPKDGQRWRGGEFSDDNHELISRLTERRGTVCYHMGWIPESFENIADEVFAFIHLDVDLYQPTLDSCRWLYSQLHVGGVLVCDDYGFDTCPGARLAMDEYFGAGNIVELPTGQGFVVKR